MARIPDECADMLLRYLYCQYEPPSIWVPDEYKEDFALDDMRILAMVWQCGERLKARSGKVWLRYVRGIYPEEEQGDDGMATMFGRDGEYRPGLNDITMRNGKDAHYLFAALTFHTLAIAYGVDLEEHDDALFIRSLAHLSFHSRKQYRTGMIDDLIEGTIQPLLFYESSELMLEHFLDLVKQVAWKSWYDWKRNLLSDIYVDNAMDRIERYCKGD